MTDRKSVLIVGETPEKVDSDAGPDPPGTRVVARTKGRIAHLVYLDTKETAPEQLAQALDGNRFDVIVVGAGLRIIPRQTEMFEMKQRLVATALALLRCASEPSKALPCPPAAA
jgi:hypothetical protein